MEMTLSDLLKTYQELSELQRTVVDILTVEFTGVPDRQVTNLLREMNPQHTQV